MDSPTIASSSVATPGHTALHDWFDLQASATPERIAVEQGAETLTYDELKRRSERLARVLVANGVEKGAFVGLCVERSVDALVGTLGILKAGAAFVPIDFTHPAERVRMIIEDARLSIAVANAGAASFISPLVARTIRLDQLDRQELAPAASLPAIGSSDLAYIMFTSGSTGRPKGTLITHGNVCALMTWAAETFSAGEFSRMLAATSFCFDISIFEIFAPLTSGGSVVLVNNHLDLLTQTAQLEVSSMCACASPLMEIVRAGKIPRSVTTLLQCGEALTLDLSKKIFASSETLNLWNIYGPTEATVYSTAYRLPRTLAEEPPIGRALTGERCYILDEALAPVADGEIGELFIAGAGVASGYLDRPELTTEKFLADPFAPGSTMYRTGDLVRLGADGEIRYVGRRDFQVKMSGFRIELGEIEVALSRHPLIDQVAVLVQETGEQKTLVMYVVTSPDAVLPLAEVQAFLGTTLPHYMIPGRLRRLERMPYGPTGKIDRNALRNNDRSRPRDIGPYEAPMTPLEAQIVLIVESLLGVDGVGVTDSFFELGGKSLIATRFLAEVHALFAPQSTRRPTIDELTTIFFEEASVRALAMALDTHQSELDIGTTHRQIVAYPSRRHPGRWLFYLHGMYGGDGFHAIKLAAALRQEISVAIVHPHGQHDRALPPPIEQMATDILTQMRELQPQGPYLLGGFCVGGLVAFEIACKLREMGESVESLFMISTPFPEGKVHAYLRAAFRFLHKPPKQMFARLGQVVSRDRRSPVDGRPIDDERNRAFDQRYAQFRARDYHGAVTCIWGANDPEARISGTERWRRVIQTIDTFHVPGGHFCAEESLDAIAGIVLQKLVPTASSGPGTKRELY